MKQDSFREQKKRLSSCNNRKRTQVEHISMHYKTPARNCGKGWKVLQNFCILLKSLKAVTLEGTRTKNALLQVALQPL